jgi:hypothetical protein
MQFGEAIDGNQARLQLAELGFRPNADTDKFVTALDDLEWLPEIVTRDGEEQRLEVRKFLWLRGNSHVAGDRSPCHPDSIEGPLRRRPDMHVHIAHIVLTICLSLRSCSPWLRDATCYAGEALILSGSPK